MRTAADIADHRISVFARFNWSLLERIHLATFGDGVLQLQ